MLTSAMVISFSKTCPVCRARTERVRTPWPLRWLKLLFAKVFSFRRCFDCHSWRGMVLAYRSHAPKPPIAVPDHVTELALMRDTLTTILSGGWAPRRPRRGETPGPDGLVREPITPRQRAYWLALLEQVEAEERRLWAAHEKVGVAR